MQKIEKENKNRINKQENPTKAQENQNARRNKHYAKTKNNTNAKHAKNKNKKRKKRKQKNKKHKKHKKLQ